MTKEEKIQEAYGEHFDKIKCVLDANGWILMTISITREISIEFERQVRVHENNTYGFPTMCVRPKSLQGIENNNGWIKIESEDDLPKEKEFFRFIPCNKFDEEFTGWIDKELGEVLFIDFKYYDCKKDGKKFITESNAWLTCQITHYQPIQKPQPPIY